MPARLALITGASSGIGASFARAYARRSFDVALVARRRDRLEALAAELRQAHGVAAQVVPADLADPAAPAAIFEALEGRTVDVLVNNAGYGLSGAFHAHAWAEQANFIQVMVTACADLAYRAIPPMQAQNYGRIINVASVAGLLPGARGHTLYGAAKAFLIKMSQSLNLELDGTGVHVTALCPGFTRSEFHDVNQTRDLMDQAPDWVWSSPEDVVEAGIAAVEANRAVETPGLQYKGLVGLAKLLPNEAAMTLMRSQTARFRKG